MAESKPAGPASSSAAPAAAAPKNEGNPAFRAMGLPRLRKKLPSRNWLIFFGVVGAWTTAVVYDRRERRRIQQKYCDAVSHLADEQLQTNSMPRKIRIFLGAPPGDYLNSARDYFKEYIKPILVASAVDWEVFEGRKEGDIRWKLAETIRERRRKAGEGEQKESQDPDVDEIIKDLRQRSGISESSERGGDMVIGRHTWKEYVRGLHEGWLGPVNPPASLTQLSEGDGTQSTSDAVSESSSGSPNEISDLPAKVVENLPGVNEISSHQTNVSSGIDTEPKHEGKDDVSPTAGDAEGSKESKAEEADKKTEPDLTIPYIRPENYGSATLSSTVPENFPPSVAVGYPHLLGFLNTPIRIWRFLHRREIAETAGSAVTAFILAPDDDIRPIREASSAFEPHYKDQTDSEDTRSELDLILHHEERDWHKSARKPNEPGQEDKERPWQEDMVTEPSVTSRMRTIDVMSFLQQSGLAATDREQHAGPTDLAAAAVANAAGNVLNGSSGGEEEDTTITYSGPKVIEWKGSADRMEPLSWTDFFKTLVGMEVDNKRQKPWQQGFEGDEDA